MRRHRATILAALVAFTLTLPGAFGIEHARAADPQRLSDATAAWLSATLHTHVPPASVHAVPTDARRGWWARSVVSDGRLRIEAEDWLVRGWRDIDRGSMFADPVTTHVLLHELLHLHRATYLEEGVVDAVALDLVAPWSGEFLGTTSHLSGYGRTARDAVYPAEVRLVRALSARATGGHWRAREARRWRWRLLVADEPGRQAMVAEANGRAWR